MTSKFLTPALACRRPTRRTRLLALAAALAATLAGTPAVHADDAADPTPPPPPTAASPAENDVPQAATVNGPRPDQPSPETATSETPPDTTPRAPADALPEAAAEDEDACTVQTPILTPRDESADGASWARDWLFRSVCRSAQWFDSFFGEERFDDAASRMRGNAFLIAENRQGHGLKWKPGLRVRVSLPNVSKRFDVFFDRDEEQNTIEGRADPATTPLANRPTGVRTDEDSTQVGIGYRLIQELDELLNFRVGVRARGGSLRPFVQGRYRHEFFKTEATQWVFTETLFWRKPDGFGQTTALDYEAAMTRSLLFRWFNNATYSELSNGFSWQSGVSFYQDLGDARAVQLQLSSTGETGAQVDVANYGVRLSYRQTIGRPWLFGEVFTGLDHPRADIDPVRREEAFFGVRTEIHFGRQ